VPAVYGEDTAHRVSASCHGVMVVFLVALGAWVGVVGFNVFVYGVGVAVSSILLMYEHIIAEHDIGKAFFTVNVVVSAALFGGVVGAVLV